MSEKPSGPSSLLNAAPIGVLVLVAMLTSFFSGGKTSNPPKGSSGSSAATATHGEPDGGGGSGGDSKAKDAKADEPIAGLNLILEHFGRPPIYELADEPESQRLVRIECAIKSAIKGRSKPRAGIDCLIATISDPIDSHFQLNFDGQLSAMMQSAEQLNFVLDRYDFSWQADAGSKKPARAAHARPSSVLLRRSASKDQDERLLLIMLVGETPTTGLHSAAFQRALDLATAVQHVSLSKDARDKCHEAQYYVVGPCYSGTCDSLRHALEAWRERQFALKSNIRDAKFVIRSGSATSPSNKERLDFTIDSEVKLPTCVPRLESTYSACVHSDDVMFDTLLDYIVDDRKIDPKDIVILTESGTAYGNAATSNRENVKPARKENQEEERKEQERRVFEARTRHKKYRALRFVKYPMALSRLRSAYPNDAATPANSLDTRPERNRHLSLTADNGNSPIDVLPFFSRNAHVVSDIIIEQIFASAIRDNVRAIGIIGTDPLDKAFLAKRIRQFAPDVLLFTLEADVLYTHSDSARATDGMLVASTYPLFARSQDWFDPREMKQMRRPNDESFVFDNRREVHLSSDIIQGIYNATLSVLGEMQKQDVQLVDYQFPNQLFLPINRELAERNQPEEVPTKLPETNKTPPVWILSSHMQGFWPVNAFANKSPQLYSARDNGPAKISRDHPPSMYVAVGISLLIFGCLIVLVIASLVQLPPGLLETWSTLLANIPPGPTRPRKSWLNSLWYSKCFKRTKHCFCRRLSALLRFLIDLPIPISIPRTREWILRALPASDLTAEFNDNSWFDKFGHHVTRIFAATIGLTCLLAIQIVACTPALLFIHRSEVVAIPITGPSPNVFRVDGWEDPRIALTLWTTEVTLKAIVVTWVTLVFTQIIFATYDVIRGTGELVWLRIRLRWIAFVVAIIASIYLDSSTVFTKLFHGLNHKGNIRAIDFMIAFERAGTYRGDVTPQIPLFALFLVLFACSVYQLRVKRFVVTYPLSNPFHGARPGLQERVVQLSSRLQRLFFWPTELQDWAVIILTLVSAHYVCFDRWVPTMEHEYCDQCFRWLLSVSAVALILLVIRIKSGAGLFLRLLRHIASQPYAGAVQRVPKRLAQLVSGHLFAPAPSPDDLLPIVESIRTMNSVTLPQEILDTLDRASLPRILATAAVMSSRVRREQFAKENDAAELRNHIAEYMRNFMFPAWERLLNFTPQRILIAPPFEEDRRRWIEAAETAIALYMVDMIRQVFAYLRNMTITAVAMAVLLLWAINSYPFIPRGLLNAYCIALILWTVFAVVGAVVRFNRDEILSVLGESPPNQFTWDRQLVLQLLTFGVVPILGTLSLGVPALENSLFSWVQVLQQLLRT